jgi:hypothetical protein
MAYAEGTKVTVGQTKSDIEDMVKKKGARSFISGHRDGRAVVLFELEDRRMQFSIPVPDDDEEDTRRRQRLERERWRALHLCIKSKFVSVETGVETLDEAFLAHIVVQGGGTVFEHMSPELDGASKTGKLPPLLASGRR